MPELNEKDKGDPKTQDYRVEAASQALFDHLLSEEAELDGVCAIYLWRCSGSVRLGSTFRYRITDQTGGQMNHRFSKALLNTAIDMRIKSESEDRRAVSKDDDRSNAPANALLDLFEGVPASTMMQATNVSEARFEEICSIVRGLRKKRHERAKENE
jgi:hypothetical protein